MSWLAFTIFQQQSAEERRLFYVGMTRAKDRLLLSRLLKRLWRGRVRAQAPSPFLADIESELTRQQQAQAARPSAHIVLGRREPTRRPGPIVAAAADALG
jgi:DNA helicase-2/ATP-dependent DNA helicase PcrA